MMGRTALWLGLGLGFAGTVGATLAQNAKPAAAPAKPPAAAAPVSADPASTSATFGDWVMRCQRIGEGDKVQRVCEAAQTIQVQGQQAPLAQIAFGRVAAGDPMRMTVALPPNVSLPSSVTVSLAENGPATVDLAWRRCLPIGCIADAVPSPDALKALRGATDPGRLNFKDATGRDIAVPLSLRGLPQALDALAKA